MRDDEQPFARQLGERIARLRRSKGWKQTNLASRIGCSTQQMSKLERGHWRPPFPVIVQLSETFNATIDYLLTGRGPRNSGVDLRLRERLPMLERLPEPQRDSLIEFLDALIMAHRCLGNALLPGGEEESERQKGSPRHGEKHKSKSWLLW